VYTNKVQQYICTVVVNTLRSWLKQGALLARGMRGSRVSTPCSHNQRDKILRLSHIRWQSSNYCGFVVESRWEIHTLCLKKSSHILTVCNFVKS